MIHVVATIDLHPGTRAAFLEAFSALAPTVRAEAGCISYVPTVDFEPAVPGQTAMGPDRVVVVEQWAGVEELAAHGAAPHMKAYRSATKAYVRGMELRILQGV